MSPAPLPERLRALPCAPLKGAPTPVDRLERFEAAIRSPYPIFIKRDDAIPFGFGGNKVRKLELVMAQAMGEGATTVITCGGVQSNHCRATAAAAARLGLTCHLVLSGAPPEVLTGNTRLDELFGAAIHFVPGRTDRSRPFLVPLGASTPIGAVGLALGVFELLDQGHRPNVIVHASSIVVDHTYTAKALAGLVALVREGSLPSGSSILFWHTGGQVGVLA